MTRLQDTEIAALLEGLEGWTQAEQAIRRAYVLPSFRSALAFVAFVGELAEHADHHPDLDIRYNKVLVTLSTHSAGGLTEKDFNLARRIDQKV